MTEEEFQAIEDKQWQERQNQEERAPGDWDNLSESDWAKMMNEQQIPSGPGIANLDLYDSTRRPEVLDIPENPEERCVGDWTKFMGSDSRNNHAVNILDNE